MPRRSKSSIPTEIKMAHQHSSLLWEPPHHFDQSSKVKDQRSKLIHTRTKTNMIWKSSRKKTHWLSQSCTCTNHHMVSTSISTKQYVIGQRYHITPTHRWLFIPVEDTIWLDTSTLMWLSRKSTKLIASHTQPEPTHTPAMWNVTKNHQEHSHATLSGYQNTI